jgi:hypothetical protein
MTPDLKRTVKKMIREAIHWQNRQVLFTCRQCCFYVPDNNNKTHRPAKCNLDESNKLVLAKRMPTQLPECFIFDPLMSAFADVLTLMHNMGIDFHDAKRGWDTIVGRIAARADRYGYVTGVTQKNLDKYGTE